eukprot:15464986-Alexandrium_andersonii.AAC.1
MKNAWASARGPRALRSSPDLSHGQIVQRERARVSEQASERPNRSKLSAATSGLTHEQADARF